MAARLVIAPEAEQDFKEAYNWYEDRRVGLGEEYLTAVDACVQAICRHPEAYQLVHRNYRRSLVRRFPYALFFEYAESTVIVYGIFHTSRNPKRWRQRLP